MLILLLVSSFLFLNGLPPLFTRVAQTYKKESISKTVYANDTDSMNNGMK